jgi:hypothetical protein
MTNLHLGLLQKMGAEADQIGASIGEIVNI